MDILLMLLFLLSFILTIITLFTPRPLSKAFKKDLKRSHAIGIAILINFLLMIAIGIIAEPVEQGTLTQEVKINTPVEKDETSVEEITTAEQPDEENSQTKIPSFPKILDLMDTNVDTFVAKYEEAEIITEPEGTIVGYAWYIGEIEFGCYFDLDRIIDSCSSSYKHEASPEEVFSRIGLQIPEGQTVVTEFRAPVKTVHSYWWKNPTKGIRYIHYSPLDLPLWEQHSISIISTSANPDLKVPTTGYVYTIDSFVIQPNENLAP